MSQAAAKRNRVPEFSLVIIGLGVVMLLIFTGNLQRLLDLFFNRTALFIAVVMLVEYVIIKGFDRSAQYKRQLEASQSKRREDLLTLQRVEQKLAALEATMESASKENPTDIVVEKARSQIAEIRADIKSRG